MLPFDTVAPATGRKTCPMRLLSPTAGPGYGMHFPLHTGAHVMVAHLHDDPDRPVLVGALPNRGNVTPLNELQAARGALGPGGRRLHFGKRAIMSGGPRAGASALPQVPMRRQGVSFTPRHLSSS